MRAGLTVAVFLAGLLADGAAGQVRHRYVIKPIQIPGESSNLSRQFSEQLVDRISQRLRRGSDPNFEVVLEGDERVEPCRDPYESCDLVNLAQMFRQPRFPLRVDGKPNEPPKHGQLHDAVCVLANDDCWSEAIEAAAACIRLHHDVVHLGRPARNPRICSEYFKHGGQQ